MLQLNIDCLNLIFNELEDRKSLHSCLLVNREWCCLVVPILWKKYSWGHEKELYYENVDYEDDGEDELILYNAILSWLPSSSKKLFSKNDIKLPSTVLLKPPLFNYISFCKFPTSDDVENIIDLVLGEINNDDKRNLLEQEIYKLFISQCKNIKELHWITSQPLSLFPGASTCFSLLHELRIEADFVSSDALHEMAQICKDLNTLIISNPTLPELFSLIDAQRNLKILKIYNSYNKKGSNKELGEALIRKGNTLKCLHLRPVGTIPPSFLTSLINITEISISSDGIHKDKEIHKYLSISEFPNLEILKVDRLSCFEELASLIEKTKGNISCVCITTVNKSAKNTDMLIKAIANNCPNIKYLYTYLIPQDFIHVKSLLLNCCFLEKLAFDSINFFANKNDNIGDELLDILTKFSPKSLKDIAITEKWKFSTISLENFFKKRLLYSFDIIFDSCNHDQHYFTANHEYMVMKYVLEGVISQSNCDYSFLYN